MEIIRPVFSDKNVAVRKCFLKASNNILYHDAEFKKALTGGEAVDAYLKGVVIYDPDNYIYYTPIKCEIFKYGGIDHSDLAQLLCIKENDQTPTSADVLVVTSDKPL